MVPVHTHPLNNTQGFARELSNPEELSKIFEHLFVVMWLLRACCPSLGFGFRIARYGRSKSKKVVQKISGVWQKLSSFF
jgi:hypothetical protein